MPLGSKPGRDPLGQLMQSLGYEFKDAALLSQALTHGSSSRTAKDYERLEFLGDRVLALVMADALFRQHRKENEGKLAARHSALVRGEVCAEMGKAMGLEHVIRVGDTEKRTGVHRMQSVLGDVAEAVIGAVYVDGGYAAAQKVVMAFWAEALKRPETAEKDAKTYLQEWGLSKALPLPRYEMVGRSGPEHRPVFKVRLELAQHAPAEGTGPTKQAAEMAAATAFIAREGLR